jgi:hypothetical protein
MSKIKPNLAAVEQAIAKKYGIETIQNPNANWTPEKERDYLEQQKAAQQTKQDLDTKTEKVEVDGVLVPKKLLNKDSRRICAVCEHYSFKSQDDVYMTKFDCCYNCYIQWVEGREVRWKKGWRPGNK